MIIKTCVSRKPNRLLNHWPNMCTHLMFNVIFSIGSSFSLTWLHGILLNAPLEFGRIRSAHIACANWCKHLQNRRKRKKLFVKRYLYVQISTMLGSNRSSSSGNSDDVNDDGDISVSRATDTIIPSKTSIRDNWNCAHNSQSFNSFRKSFSFGRSSLMFESPEMRRGKKKKKKIWKDSTE